MDGMNEMDKSGEAVQLISSIRSIPSISSILSLGFPLDQHPCAGYGKGTPAFHVMPRDFLQSLLPAPSHVRPS